MTRFNKPKLSLRYVANSGVCLATRHKKILINAIHSNNKPPYHSVPAKSIEEMVLAKEPYNNIDLLLFTHNHEDYFSASLTNEVLKRNKLIQLFGTKDVIEDIKNEKNHNELLAPQIRTSELSKGRSLKMTIREISFEIFNLVHDDVEDKGYNYDNFAYIFELNNKIFLYVGNTISAQANFESSGIFGKYQIDYMIAPFSFIGRESGRKTIEKLDPSKIFISHLPQQKYDAMDWIGNTMKAYDRYKASLPPVEFMTTLGQEYKLK